MATAISNHWARDFWSDALTSRYTGFDSLYEQLEYLYYADIGHILEANSRRVVAVTDDGSRIEMTGRNLDAYYADEVLINSLVVSGADFNLEAQGSIVPTGYWGMTGLLNKISVQTPQVSMAGTGSYYYADNGYMLAENVTEEVWLEDTKVVSKTNEQGLYVSHSARIGEKTFDIQGQWNYAPVERWNDLFQGDDTLTGGAFNDFLQGFSGNDELRGGGGTDTALYQGFMGDYQIQRLDSGQIQVRDSLTNRDGADLLTDVERIEFIDESIAFDVGLGEKGGQAYRLYQAAFGRTPDKEGLGFWLKQIDDGMDLMEVSARFVDSQEFKNLYGHNPDNDLFLERLYDNILGRIPDQGGFDWWLNEMSINSEKTQTRVLLDFSESHESYQNMIEVTGDSFRYDAFL